MLIIKVELPSAVDGHIEEIARMRLCSDGSGVHGYGNYIGEVYRGRSFEALDKSTVHKLGKVRNYPRLTRHVWNLIALMLSDMGYGAVKK